MANEIPDKIRKELSTWNATAVFHRAAYVILGLFGVLCPLVVSSFADSLATWQVRVLSFLAAASVAIFAAFDVGNLATRWREAWKHLNTASIEYEAGIIKMEDLAKAYREGEAIIGTMKSDVFAALQKARHDPSTQNQASQPAGSKSGTKSQISVEQGNKDGAVNPIESP
jgi:hypothetical protein